MGLPKLTFTELARLVLSASLMVAGFALLLNIG